MLGPVGMATAPKGVQGIPCWLRGCEGVLGGTSFLRGCVAGAVAVWWWGKPERVDLDLERSGSQAHSSFDSGSPGTPGTSGGLTGAWSPRRFERACCVWC